MTCSRKHTVPQIPDEYWKCSKCGEVDNFVLEPPEGMEDKDEDCPLLHDDDDCVCYSCGNATTAKRFAASFAKKNDLVACPCCAGKGLLPSKKAASIKEKLK